MYRLRRIRPASVVLAVIVVGLVALLAQWLTGDGSASDAAPPLTEAGRPYAAALAARLIVPGDMWAGFTGLTDEQARCVAGPWVMIVGPDELEDAGAGPGDFGADPAGTSGDAGLSWDDAQRIQAQYERCGLEPRALIARSQITAFDEVGRSVSLDAIVECMADKLDEDAARRAFLLSLTEPSLGTAPESGPAGITPPPTVDPDVNRELQNAAAACA